MISNSTTGIPLTVLDAFAAINSRSSGADSQATSQDPASLAAQVSTAESAMLNDLLSNSDGQPSLLAQLTNIPYSQSNPPDVLQVSAGSDVTPEFAGGYKSVGWVGDGAEVTFFSTGQPPNAVKGVAISYGQNTSAASRQTTLQMAQSYLDDHLSDAQNAAGAWNQPTFDVQVH